MIKLPLKLALLLLAAVAATALWQQAQLSVLALGRIDPLPETRAMVAQQRYAEAADYLGFFMAHEYVKANPDAQALRRRIADKRVSVGYQTGKLAEGVLAGTSDEAIGQAAGVVSDFLVIGDLRDLAVQGLHLAKGEETDGVLVALASLGLLATGAQVASGGATAASAGAAAPTAFATTAAKSGLVALKTARRLGKLPPWLGRTIVQSTGAVRQTKSLAPITDLLGDVNTLVKTRGGFRLLDKTTDAASLRRMVAFSGTFGPKSATLYRIGGDLVVDSALRAGRLGKDTVELAATFGRGGLRALDKVGATSFVKYSARASKISYKGDALRLIAGFLTGIPGWVLYAVMGAGTAVWLPWRRLLRIDRRSRRNGLEPRVARRALADG